MIIIVMVVIVVVAVIVTIVMVGITIVVVPLGGSGTRTRMEWTGDLLSAVGGSVDSDVGTRGHDIRALEIVARNEVAVEV